MHKHTHHVLNTWSQSSSSGANEILTNSFILFPAPIFLFPQSAYWRIPAYQYETLPRSDAANTADSNLLLRSETS